MPGGRRGFNRHTFLCGQSGSGKTYSLGVILERLLIETDLRLVILDPNSDFVRLGDVRADADPALADRYQEAARGVVVYSAGGCGERRLRLHAADVDPATQAAVLRLDPFPIATSTPRWPRCSPARTPPPWRH